MKRKLPTRLLGSTVLPTLITVAALWWLFSDVNWVFVRELDFTVIYTYRVALLQGLGNTLLITFFSLLLGLALGLACACLLYVPFAPLRWFIMAYVEVLRIRLWSWPCSGFILRCRRDRDKHVGVPKWLYRDGATVERLSC